MKKKLLVSALSTMVALTIFAGCSDNKKTKSTSEKDDKKTSQILKVGIGSELSTLDVSQAMDNTACDVMSQVGEGLFSFGKKGEAVPAIAKEVVEPSKDGLTYVFELRDDAKWSNGEPVTAHDFEYSWKRTVDPKTASPQAYYFSGIKNYQDIADGKKASSELGVKALSDTKLQVTLNYPMSYFQQLLAVPAFYPLNQKFVEKQGDKYGTDAQYTLFNGPFVMEKWSGSDMKWTYKPNKYYWDKKNVKLKEISVRVFKEVSTAKKVFDSDGVDDIKISDEFVEQEEGNDALHEYSIPGTYYLQYNTKNKILKNKKARQALSYAIDSNDLAKHYLKDGSEKALGFVPRGFLNKETGKDFAKEVGNINKANLKKAKKLWNEAKKELGIDKAKLTILCSDAESSKKLAEYLQGSLSDTLDVKIDVDPVPFNNRLDRSRKGDFDMVIGGWTPVYADPIDFLNLYVSTTSNNFGKFNNKEYDQLIQDANETYALDYQKRWDALKKADEILADEAPVKPLYQVAEVHLTNPKVHNLYKGPLGSSYFKQVYIK